MLCVGHTSRVRNKYCEKQEILRNQTLCSPSWECPALEGVCLLRGQDCVGGVFAPPIARALKDFRGALSSRLQLPEAEVSLGERQQAWG